MGLSSRMGELERAVMEHLWSVEGERNGGHDRWRTVREVHASLAAERDIAYTTVMTVMQRLSRKALVRQRKDGRAHLYRAAGSRGAMTADLMRWALAEFTQGDPIGALHAFIGGSTREEREVLRRALAEHD